LIFTSGRGQLVGTGSPALPVLGGLPRSAALVLNPFVMAACERALLTASGPR